MEGISGVVNLNDLSRKGDDYDNARLWVTGDINAAVEGAIEGGADEFTVREAHHGLIYHKLHPKARLVKGMPSHQWTMDRSINRYGATCLPIEEAQKRIREKARTAMDKIDRIEPHRLESPYTLEIETIDPAIAHRMALMPGTKYDGNRKVTYTCDDFMENHHAFLTIVSLSRTEFYLKPH